MKHTCLFWLLIPLAVGIMTVLLSPTSVSVFSSTSENNTVLQQAQKSLDANQKQLATVTPKPVPSAVQWIHGTSMVQGVLFTWVIISSDSEVSVNLRHDGDDTTPPVSVAATALMKSGGGKPVTMKGSVDLNAAWISPSTVNIEMNGESSLYDSTSIDVVASALGSSQPPSPSSPSPSPPSTASPSNDNQITSPAVKPQGVLKVLSSNAFIDSIGYLHVVGEIQNATPDSVTFVKATATFYDKNNNVVATDYSYTSPSDLGPGDKAPFEIILTSASIPVKQIHHRTIIASSG